MNIFDKYASKIDSKELAASQKEIKENASSSGDYPEIPIGKYEVKVENIVAKKSSNGNPMVSIQFRILTGKYEKSCLFYNGVFHEDWMRHRVCKLLSDLIDDGDRTAEINLILKGSLSEANEFCMDVAESISGSREYMLKYDVTKAKNGKTYNTFVIEEVYDA